jgi:hypothetical protein
VVRKIPIPAAAPDGIVADPTDHDLIFLNLFRRKVAHRSSFLIAKMNMYQPSRLVERARVELKSPAL